MSLKKYVTGESRKKRCYTLVKWAHSITYYFISSIAAYLILKETTFLPTWMGGSGHYKETFRYLVNFDEANIYMKVFYIIQFGKHLGRFFHHSFIRS